MATPHHGSYLTENPLSNLARRLINMPSNLVHLSQDIVQLNMQGVLRQPLRTPTSLDNMNAKNPFLRTLVTLPIADGVKAHSLVAVRSAHSVQGQPQAIEEVRRILYAHIGETPASAALSGYELRRTQR